MALDVVRGAVFAIGVTGVMLLTRRVALWCWQRIT
jgi:hypothetical protein